jgi:hypothetical protein
MKRTIQKKGNKLQIIFEGEIFVPGFQNNGTQFTKTLQSQFKKGDVVKVNSASSGIGVSKDGIRECWINP